MHKISEEEQNYKCSLISECLMLFLKVPTHLILFLPKVLVKIFLIEAENKNWMFHEAKQKYCDELY